MTKEERNEKQRARRASHEQKEKEVRMKRAAHRAVVTFWHAISRG